MNLPPTTLCVKAVGYIQKVNPNYLEDILKRIEKPEPHFLYIRTMSEVLEKFLQRRNLTEENIQGVHISRQMVFERTIFIAVILWLYSPAVYIRATKYNIENGVRHELEGILLCNEEWISQQVDKISFDYNSNYQEFRDTINDLLSYIKENVKEKQVERELVKEPMSMFQ